MFETSKHVLENLMFLIGKYGYMPNGTRVYYLNRSQPPYFSLMAMTFYEYCMKSDELSLEQKDQYRRFVLDEALVYMKKEYLFWMTHRSVKVKHNGSKFTMNIYNSDLDRPRPESYFEDLNTAKSCTNEQEKARMFRDIAAAAESGIDFSSRWFSDPMKMETIHTTNIIPVDLNALLYKVEVVISNLSKLKGDLVDFRKFRTNSIKRKSVINSLMWSSKLNSWADYDLVSQRLNEENFYITNLSPLWMDIKPPRLSVRHVIDSNMHILSENAGGVPFSLVNSSQQWDFSNVWPPNQHSIIMMLLKHNRELALLIAKKFFNSVYLGWLNTGLIYEKYNAVKPGERGSGGEYVVQSGFGWSNGAILSIIQTFKDELVK
jgi:alpha,alpha-trehalase